MIKNQKIDDKISQIIMNQTFEKKLKLEEGKAKQMRREEVKHKVDQEFNKKIYKTNQKLSEIDRRAEELYKKREKEKLINIELEAIRRREKEAEAKRIQRVQEYERKKAAEEKEREHMKTSFLLAKRQEIKELRKTVTLNSKLYKEKVKQEIESLKRQKKLDPNNIKIEPVQDSIDKVMITHTACKFCTSFYTLN